MIYVTGDMHGDIERFYGRDLKKLKKDDTLIILGDFGFVWQGGEEEKKSLDFICSRRYNVLFLEGTHENFELLKEYPVEQAFGGRVRSLGGNLKQLMRGEIYTIEDKTIFALGGGRSDDLEFRQEGKTWWPEELPSEEELEAANDKIQEVKKVDFVLTHDAPQKIRVSLTGDEEEPSRLCAFFDKMMYSLKYTNWFFGCYHLDRKLTRTHYAVYKKVIEITNPEKKSFLKKLFKRK